MILWTNDYTLDDDTIAFYNEEYPGMSEDDMYISESEQLAEHYDNVREACSVETDEDIIALTSGRNWKSSGYRFAELGERNTYECFELPKWDCTVSFEINDDGDLIMDESNHDGSSETVFRIWKEEVDEITRESLLYTREGFLELYRNQDKYTTSVGKLLQSKDIENELCLA